MTGDAAAVLRILDDHPDLARKDEHWAFQLRVASLTKTSGAEAAKTYVDRSFEERPDFLEARRRWVATFEGHPLPDHEVRALQLLAIDPDDHFALIAMARIEYLRGRWKESLRYAWRALGHGAPAGVWTLVGCNYLALRDDREADKAFTRALSGEPGETHTEQEVALAAIGALELSGRFQDAEALARVYLSDYGASPDVLRVIARTRWRQDDPDEAKAILEQAVSIDGDERASASVLAVITADEGDREEASRLADIASAGSLRMADRFPEVYVAWRFDLEGADRLLDGYEREMPIDPDVRWMRERDSAS